MIRMLLVRSMRPMQLARPALRTKSALDLSRRLAARYRFGISHIRRLSLELALPIRAVVERIVERRTAVALSINPQLALRLVGRGTILSVEHRPLRSDMTHHVRREAMSPPSALAATAHVFQSANRARRIEVERSERRGIQTIGNNVETPQDGSHARDSHEFITPQAAPESVARTLPMVLARNRVPAPQNIQATPTHVDERHSERVPELKTARTRSAEMIGLAPGEFNRLTEQVIGAIDRRILAERERHGRF